ncbi:MAG: PaaI family thioesterase [Chloroflexota bacterium]
MIKEEHFRKLEHMYVNAPLNKYFRPKLHITEGQARLTLPVREEFFHAAGAVHGSVIFKALDDTAFFAVSSLIENVFVLTVSFNIYLIRAIQEGEMTAVGRVVHHGRRLFIAESEVTDNQGQVIARGSGTFMLSSIPLSPDIGYT